jgi:hypothetical protein
MKLKDNLLQNKYYDLALLIVKLSKKLAKDSRELDVENFNLLFE